MARPRDAMNIDTECDNCGEHHDQRRCPECGWRNHTGHPTNNTTHPTNHDTEQ
jgi:hypothetical protein